MFGCMDGLRRMYEMLERSDEARRTGIVGWSYEDGEEKIGCERKTPDLYLAQSVNSYSVGAARDGAA